MYFLAGVSATMLRRAGLISKQTDRQTDRERGSETDGRTDGRRRISLRVMRDSAAAVANRRPS